MEGNKRFQAGTPAFREFTRKRIELCRGQRPKVVVLSCSDSRVSPTLIFDKTLGELFVVKTAGNLADRVALGSIEYAAEYLQSAVLVILGHEQCGAVGAAATGSKMLTPNLESIVRKIHPALKNVQGPQGSARWLRLAERANVHQSGRDILRHSSLLRRKVAAGNLTLIKALYRLRTGKVVRLAD